MGHCGGPAGGGGAATDQFDLLTPLANWVENGVPPGPINATGVNFTPATYQVSFVSGPATRASPLCPYPQQARFTGKVTVIGGVPVASNPGGFGRSDKISMHCRETMGIGRTARSQVTATRIDELIERMGCPRPFEWARPASVPTDILRDPTTAD